MSKTGTDITVQSQLYCFPYKFYEKDAAYNLQSAEKVEVLPHTRVHISLGFKIDIPANMAMIIQPRRWQSGKGMIGCAVAPKWLGGDRYRVRINGDVIVGLIDPGYGGDVKATVKFGGFRAKHRIMRMLGFKFYIDELSCVCQGRFVYVPKVNLDRGIVHGTRSGLGSTDKS